MSKSSASMELVTTRAALLSLLTSASRVATNGKPIEMFASAWVRAAGDTIAWWATDTSMWRGGSIAATVTKPGIGLLPVARLLGMVKRCVEGEILLVIQGDVLKLTAGGFKASMQILPPEDFAVVPTLPDGGVEFSAVALARAIAMTSAVMDETGPASFHKGGEFQLFPDRLMLSATDGRRAARVDVPHGQALAGEARPALMLPKRALLEVASMLSECEAADLVNYHGSDNAHVFRFGTSVVVCRELEARFPQLDRVIPKDWKTTVTCDREALLQALARVEQAATTDEDKVRGVSLAVGGSRLALSAHSSGRGEASESLPVDVQGPDIEARVSSIFLRDALAAMGTESVECRINSNVTPLAFVPVGEQSLDFVGIVMPMRL